MIKMRRYISVAVIVISVFSIILGIVFLSGSNGSHTGYEGGVSRASTSIEFGADFYTTSAQYSGLAANAATDIYTILSLGFGFFFISLGLLLLLLGIFSLYSVNSDVASIQDDRHSETNLTYIKNDTEDAIPFEDNNGV